MPTAKSIVTQLLPSSASSDTQLISEIAAMVNRVYAVAEKGMWTEAAKRTSEIEIARLIVEGELAIARMDGRLVGSIHIRNLDSTIAEFGMLAAQPDCRGLGVGRELVSFAEELSRSRGRGVMQLELLVPKEWELESKVFLKDWYVRRGYKVVGQGNINETRPYLAHLLPTICDFYIYHKKLT